MTLANVTVSMPLKDWENEKERLQKLGYYNGHKEGWWAAFVFLEKATVRNDANVSYAGYLSAEQQIQVENLIKCIQRGRATPITRSK